MLASNPLLGKLAISSIEVIEGGSDSAQARNLGRLFLEHGSVSPVGTMDPDAEGNRIGPCSCCGCGCCIDCCCRV